MSMPMSAVGGSGNAVDLPAVGASAFLGASLARYLAAGDGDGDDEQDGISGRPAPSPSSPATPAAAAWEAAMVNLGALSAMVGDHLTGPVLAAAEPCRCSRGRGGGAGAGWAAGWPPSPAMLALVAGMVAIGVGVAVAVRRSGGVGGGVGGGVKWLRRV